MFTIHMLPASFGDSLLLEWGEPGNPHYILIDGGPYFNFRNLYPALKEIAPGLIEIELLVVTHIDIDHIDGIVSMLNVDELPFAIKEVWYNGWEQIKPYESAFLGAIQGEYLSYLIQEKKLSLNKHFKREAVVIKDYANLPTMEIHGLQLLLLSPGEAALENLVPVWEKEIREKLGDEYNIKKKLESDKRYDDIEQMEEKDLLGDKLIDAMMEEIVKGDDSAANGSSIAFIATFEGKSCLLSGDATSDSLLAAINPLLEREGADNLHLDAWKLSHHGSKKSTLEKLMKKINCQNMLISTDGKRYQHPNQACIAKLLKNNGPYLNLYFNYRTDFNKMWDDELLQQEYQYKAYYPKDKSVVSFSL